VAFLLIRCSADGSPVETIAVFPPAIVASCSANADLYRRVGFIEPWVGYVAVDRDQAVGGGAFVGAPKDGLVEIAYFTLLEFQGRGYATRTAAKLTEIARSSQPGIVVRAFTLQEHNASTKILQHLGFTLFGNARDPDAGDVWEWRA
jgi:[ribosomal protein S5]-alanine N-acetyltransferase